MLARRAGTVCSVYFLLSLTESKLNSCFCCIKKSLMCAGEIPNPGLGQCYQSLKASGWQSGVCLSVSEYLVERKRKNVPRLPQYPQAVSHSSGS